MGGRGALREALDRIWASVLGRPLEQQEARDLATRCEPQIHHLDDPFESVFTAPAQNAAIAVLTAVDCAVEGTPEHMEGPPTGGKRTPPEKSETGACLLCARGNARPDLAE